MPPWSIRVNEVSSIRDNVLQIIDIPTEQTTAATDALLAMFSVGAILYLSRFTVQAPLKIKIWCGMFACIAIAATLGTIVHGLVISDDIKRFLWQPLALSLSLSVGALAVGTGHDIWGTAAVQRIVPVVLMVILLLYVMVKTTAIGMVLNVIFVGGVLFFALGAYMVQAVRGQLEGAGYMSAGLMMTIGAGVIQARRLISFELIWEFDHNGTFHLVQLFALFLLLVGIRKSFP